MREIKFRAWDKWHEISEDDPSSMVEETHRVMVKLNGDVYNSEYDNDQNDRYILMQYTGLKDNNGVEIYEGDIIKAPKYERILQDELSQVSFKDGAFCLYTIEFEYHAKIPLCDIKIRNIEVVGNIYEHRGLIK